MFGLSKKILDRLDKQDLVLKDIKEQTMKTNGRVTALETDVAPAVAFVRYLMSAWGIIYLIGPLLINKIFEAVIQHFFP